MKIKISAGLLFIPILVLIGCNYTSSPSKINAPKVDITKLRTKAIEAKTFCKSKKYNINYCFLADMSLHSGVKRLFVWDFKKDTNVQSYLVGHGCGKMFWSLDYSKENPTFSNEPDSHCSSLGKYKIGERGYSNWGIHIKYLMYGLDKTNSNSISRQVVFHSWEKMDDNEIYPDGSPEGWGCPTVSNNAMIEIDKKLQDSKKPVLFWMFE